MAIQGNGPSGPKIPPKKHAHRSAEQTAEHQAEEVAAEQQGAEAARYEEQRTGRRRAEKRAPVKKTAKATPPTPEGDDPALEPPTLPTITPLSVDSFDDEPSVPAKLTGSTGGGRNVEDLWRDATGRPSQVKSMARLLERTADQLVTELAEQVRALEEKKAGLVGDDVPASLQAKGAELLAARTEVARLRRRLFGIHRRLKVLGSKALQSGEVAELGQLGGVGRAIDKAAAGDARLMTALTGLLPFAQRPIKVVIPEDAAREPLAGLLAQGTPGATLAAFGQTAAGGEAPRAPAVAESTFASQAREGGPEWASVKAALELATAGTAS